MTLVYSATTDGVLRYLYSYFNIYVIRKLEKQTCLNILKDFYMILTIKALLTCGNSTARRMLLLTEILGANGSTREVVVTASV